MNPTKEPDVNPTKKPDVNPTSSLVVYPTSEPSCLSNLGACFESNQECGSDEKLL